MDGDSQDGWSQEPSLPQQFGAPRYYRYPSVLPSSLPPPGTHPALEPTRRLSISLENGSDISDSSDKSHEGPLISAEDADEVDILSVLRVLQDDMSRRDEMSNLELVTPSDPEVRGRPHLTVATPDNNWS